MPEFKASKIILHIGYAIPFLLVVYVLSIGPVAAFILDSNGNAERPEYVNFTMTFYAPLEWCAKNNSFARDSIRAYIEICNGTY